MSKSEPTSGATSEPIEELVARDPFRARRREARPVPAPDGGRGPRTVGDVLARALAAHPDKEFLVGRGRRVTYAEFDALAARAASALAALGVRAGDRVAASLPTDVDIAVFFHGALRLGAVWLGINRNLAPPEKRFLLEDAGVSLVLADPEMATQIEAECAGLPRLREVVVCDRDARASCAWSAALDAATAPPPAVALDPHAPAGIAYTSGTTGHPKGVVHTHHNLLVPGAVLATLGDYRPDSRRGDCFPLTILNMQVLTTLLLAQVGATGVFMDRIDAEGVAEWIERERVTLFTAPTALIYSLAHDDRIAPRALATLERVFFGGGACPTPVIEAFEAKFGVPVRGTYGLTEMPTVVAQESRGERVPGASGRPLPHVRVTLRDADDAEVAPGEAGELCVEPASAGAWAGVYTPMLGYWRRPEATAEALRGGRLHTGDVARLDAGGAVVVVDRKNLLIVRGGANVYPAEVERALHEDARVEACAVVGAPDERLGERVAAFVQLAPGAHASEDELVAHCRARLAKYKVPERILFVDAMPRNAMGKIVRRELPAIELPAIEPSRR